MKMKNSLEITILLLLGCTQLIQASSCSWITGPYPELELSGEDSRSEQFVRSYGYRYLYYNAAPGDVQISLSIISGDAILCVARASSDPTPDIRRSCEFPEGRTVELNTPSSDCIAIGVYGNEDTLFNLSVSTVIEHETSPPIVYSSAYCKDLSPSVAPIYDLNQEATISVPDRTYTYVYFQNAVELNATLLTSTGRPGAFQLFIADAAANQKPTRQNNMQTSSWVYDQYISKVNYLSENSTSCIAVGVFASGDTIVRISMQKVAKDETSSDSDSMSGLQGLRNPSPIGNLVIVLLCAAVFILAVAYVSILRKKQGGDDVRVPLRKVVADPAELKFEGEKPIELVAAESFELIPPAATDS